MRNEKPEREVEVAREGTLYIFRVRSREKGKLYWHGVHWKGDSMDSKTKPSLVTAMQQKHDDIKTVVRYKGVCTAVEMVATLMDLFPEQTPKQRKTMEQAAAKNTPAAQEYTGLAEYAVSYKDAVAGDQFTATVKVTAASPTDALKAVRKANPNANFDGATVRQL
jgi:hypothetical protein